MASPLFSSYWNQPCESRYPPSCIPETASPKVISIPVHFVNNPTKSPPNRSDSAVRIQKVLRGFLLRKSVNKILTIKIQVEEIERRIAQNETVKLIRMDSKERLRINEALMALLFKLDSVRGIDSGVRDLRKGVAKKAIALQERVDTIVMLPPQEIEPVVDSIISDGDEMPIEISMPIENVMVDCQGGEIVDNEMPIENVVDSMDQGNCVVKGIVEECNSKTEMQKQDEEMDDWCKGVEEAKTGEVTKEMMMISEEGGEKKSNEDLQSQMIRMMSELVEKNETQTRMINSLTQRVAQLEKAFLLRRSNKKKKRHHDDGKQQ